MNIYTIGFTKKNAEIFFKLLKSAKISKLIDVRLNTISQLAGYAKRDDLNYFLREICNIEYVYSPKFAPNKEILDNYKKKIINWENYEKQYLKLIENRKPLTGYSPDYFDNSCLLCSEHEPVNCHRRLAVEYINRSYGDIFKIKHLY